MMDPWNLARPRIGVASLVQETNTFSPRPTRWEDYTVLVGEQAAKSLKRTNTEFAGAFSALRRMGAEPVPLVAAWALPSGKVTDEAFARLAGLLDDSLKSAGSLQGLVLSLHGAMASESLFDADSALIETARRRIGDVALGVCLDLHANVTDRMVQLADVLVGYHTEPHTDMASTGKRIARLVTAVSYGEIAPSMALAKRPLLIPAEAMRTDVGPMAEVRRLAYERAAPHMLDVSLFPVQPWLDVPELGLGVSVVADADPTGARSLADELADEIWQRKERMTTPRLLTPDRAFRMARASGVKPFIMAHTADCPTAGAPGDDPVMIGQAALHGPDLVVMHTVLDPSAVDQCRAAVGQRVRVEVGGRVNPGASSVVVDGIVRRVGAGSYRLAGRSFTRRQVSMGEWAVLQSGFHHLLVTSEPAISADPATWRHVGLDPDQADVLVVRSCSDYRANFPESAAEAVTLDLPGASGPRLEGLRFRNAPRPLYPLDPL
ncbi:MAG: M81 family metallopeptidase [bacterium]|nr:M81 family metallopeptidase [bacterium]MDE0440205.1 M81 family metallopeptidase [bacterium]